MKRSDLEKHLGKKIIGQMKREPVPERYGAASAETQLRREQRRTEQAAGLVPFAVKLPADLVAALQDRAKARATTLNELTTNLLRAALAQDA
jgi:hypothetical protein